MLPISEPEDARAAGRGMRMVVFPAAAGFAVLVVVVRAAADF